MAGKDDLRKFASKRVTASARPHYVNFREDSGRGSGAASHTSFNKIATGVSNQFGGANVVRTNAKPYHPLFSSPDRLQLPVQLAQLNQYWRLFYNMDPVIGGVIDMHGAMPWSNAWLTMEQAGDNSKTILHAYEDMLSETELLSRLPDITREYYVIGEIFPYMFWDDEEGIWNHITLHNPDYVEVVDSPLINDDPILTLRPSQEMRRILQSTDPRYIRLRQKLPPEIVTMLAGGKNLPLDPLNASHISRKAFPYDIRGTSIMGRMFRILMYEDAVFNGQIQQAQRHALPLRVFKLGDPNTGWIPSPVDQDDFAQLLAEVEVDPLAAIIYHYGLQVEYHGIEGKQLKINQEWDIIERAKLVALGVSKAFLHGEVTYASILHSSLLARNDGRYVPIADIKVGDYILDKDGLPRKVLDKWDEGIINPMYAITLAGGTKLVASDKHRHPIWAWPRQCNCGCGTDVPTGRLFAPNHYDRNVGNVINSYSINPEPRCYICHHPRSKELHDAWLVERRDRHTIAEEFFPGRSHFGVFASWNRHKKNHVVIENSPAFKKTGAHYTIGRHQSSSVLPIDYEPYQKLRTDELRVGDYFMRPRKFEVQKPSQPIEFARLLGYYVAEGCLDRSSYSMLTFSANEFNTWAEDACCLANALAFTTTKHYRYSGSVAVGIDRSSLNPNCTDVWIGAGSGFLFSTHAGCYSYQKCLSQEVMCWPLDYKRELIKGIFRGDGSIQETKRFHKHRGKEYTQRHIDYRTTSEQLAYQLELILAQLGYPCSRLVQKDGGPHNDGYKRHDLHHVNIYGDAARELAKLIWDVDWPESHYVSRQQAWVDENYVYYPIEKIEEVENTENVIDITVEGSHSFLAENIGTYNSANAGLQVLMMRYRVLRDMFLNNWIYKHVFGTMAELNGFYQDPKKSDPESSLPDSRNPAMERQTMLLKDKLRDIKAMEDPDRQAYEYVMLRPVIEAHNAECAKLKVFVPMTRTAGKKSVLSKRKHLLYPNLVFEKRLDVRQDENILNFWMQMAQMGWVSPRTVVQGAGLDYDSEMATVGQDAGQIARNQLLMQSLGIGEEGGGGAGSPMGGIGIGTETGAGLGPEGGEGAVPPGGAGGMEGPASKATADSPRRKITASELPANIKAEVEKLMKDDNSVDLFVGKGE